MKIIKKLLSVLLISGMLISSIFVPVFAAYGTPQRLKHWFSSNDIPYFTATEGGEPFYVYCFNHDLSWPDRPDDGSGYTAMYVPNDLLNLSDDVKDKIHRIFYAGFPHNNAGLYIQDDNYVPSIAEMTKGLMFDPEILQIFPQLANGKYTYHGDGTGTLDNFNSTEAETIISIGQDLMDWSFIGTAEQVANLSKIMTKHTYFYAFVTAYFNVAYWGITNEVDTYLPYFFVDALGTIGATVTADEAHAATQYAIWIVLNREGVPNNSDPLDEYYVEGSLVKRLVDFAYESTPIPKRNFDQNDLNTYVTAFNDGQYLLNSNGVDIKTGGVLNSSTILQMKNTILKN